MNPPSFPTAPGAALVLDGPAGALELVVEHPEADVAPRPVVAIVCHPLSTEGGALNNKVVTMAARALRESGVTTVRFNFRGVGRSAGVFDEGVGEADDLRCVAEWVRSQQPHARLWLAGFSFGAFVSIAVASELKPGLLISIAPPVGRSWDFDRIGVPEMPWLVIQGDADEIVDAQAVYDWVDSLGAARPPVQLVKVPETSHFFHGKLMDLRGAVRNGVRAFLPPEQAG